jgi:hypothetical protein
VGPHCLGDMCYHYTIYVFVSLVVTALGRSHSSDGTCSSGGAAGHEFEPCLTHVSHWGFPPSFSGCLVAHTDGPQLSYLSAVFLKT